MGKRPKNSDLDDILDRLHAAGVEFIIVGGVAANLHGSARVKTALNLLYKHDDTNIARIVKVFASRLRNHIQSRCC